MDSVDRSAALAGPFFGDSSPISPPHPSRDQSSRAPLAPGSLPTELDSETAALLRMVVLPQIEAASSWADLVRRLGEKGFGLGFRAGRMILNRLDSGDEICTGRSLGAPLRALAARLGRPALRLSRDGLSAQLHG